MTWEHHYISTACQHAIGEGRVEMHAACRNSCKYSAPGKSESCRCPCHGQVGTQPGGVSSVDVARAMARYFLGMITSHGVPIPAEMRHRIKTDPVLFWLREGEVSIGEWRSPS
jgi:hypothetical protein